MLSEAERCHLRMLARETGKRVEITAHEIRVKDHRGAEVFAMNESGYRAAESLLRRLQQSHAAAATMKMWREEPPPEEEEDMGTFEDDVRAYQEGRLQDIEPGLREDPAYLAQLALAAFSEAEPEA